MVRRCKWTDWQRRGEKEEGGTTQDHARARIIGPYTGEARAEKGNGTHLQRIRRKQMIQMTTWKKPKIARKGRWKHQQKGDMAKEDWKKEMHDKYATTWTSPDGKTRRRINYIAINAKCRNTERQAPRNIYRHADMKQNPHRRVQMMQLYYNASKKYKKPTPDETGARLKYDMREIRRRPEKPQKRYQEQEQEQEEKTIAEWTQQRTRLDRL